VNGYRPILNGVLFSVLGNNFFNQITQNDVQADRVWLPRFGATLKAAEDVTLGLSAQRAYRAGGQGINPVRAAIFNYDAEYSWNYEFSLRALLFDKRLSFTLNAFLINWRDQQLEVALSQAVQDSQVLNLGRSRLYGAEAELLFRASRELTLFGSLGLLSTRIRADTRTPEQLAGQPSLTGNRFPFAPGYSGSVGATWRHASGFNATADVAFQGPAETLLPNSIRNDARTIANLRLGYDWGKFQAFGFVSNLFDEDYFVNAAAAGGSVVVGAPRQFGLGLTARF
jgi:outer membrane receptor protein involved in Fe transport